MSRSTRRRTRSGDDRKNCLNGFGEPGDPPAPALFRALVEQAPDGMIFADCEGVIRLWNARAEEIFGYAADEANGRSLDLIIPQHLRAAHWRGYRDAIAAGRTRSDGKPMLTRATHKDGSKLYVELAFGIVSDKRHGVLGALATARQASTLSDRCAPTRPGCGYARRAG